MEVSPLLTPLCCFSPQPYSHVPTYVPGAWHRVSSGGPGGSGEPAPCVARMGVPCRVGMLLARGDLRGVLGLCPALKGGCLCVPIPVSPTGVPSRSERSHSVPWQEAHAVRQPDRLQDIRAQQAAAELDRGGELKGRVAGGGGMLPAGPVGDRVPPAGRGQSPR